MLKLEPMAVKLLRPGVLENRDARYPDGMKVSRAKGMLASGHEM
jgi:hypothetical protein